VRLITSCKLRANCPWTSTTLISGSCNYLVIRPDSLENVTYEQLEGSSNEKGLDIYRRCLNSSKPTYMRMWATPRSRGFHVAVVSAAIQTLTRQANHALVEEEAKVHCTQIRSSSYAARNWLRCGLAKRMIIVRTWCTATNASKGNFTMDYRCEGGRFPRCLHVEWRQLQTQICFPTMKQGPILE
jgi:hypothetical protein